MKVTKKKLDFQFKEINSENQHRPLKWDERFDENIFESFSRNKRRLASHAQNLCNSLFSDFHMFYVSSD